MAQVGIFMYQRWDNMPVGVYANEAKAHQAAVNGEYVLVPIEANKTYTGGMIDETLPGATVYTATGFETRIVALENKMTTAENSIVTLDTDLDTFKTQAQNQLQGVNTALAALDVRVTALETP